ncbi:MAG: hypothetical protein Q8O19_07535 [Rectinemataceae bacterium]|nr:hypothetical protein [Rectinemataceae bacterium]
MDNVPIAEVVEKFIEHPEDFLLFRGERSDNRGGLHFTNDEEWANYFGTAIRTGKLPAGSKIKVLAEVDMSDALAREIYSEQGLWDSIFEQGYDAILGYDSMRPHLLDVIVHPKHLERFEIRQSK